MMERLRKAFLQNGNGSRYAANEKQNCAGKLDVDAWEARHKRINKDDKAADGDEDGGPDRNRSRSPECDTEQGWAEDGAGHKDDIEVAHHPTGNEALDQREQERIAAHARNLIAQRILSG